MHLIAVIALAAQSLTGPAATGWVQVDRTDNGNSAVHPATIERRGNVVRVHTRTRITAPDPLLAVARYRFDCGSRTVALEAADFYTPEGGFEASTTTSGADAAAEPIQPGSPNDRVAVHVCPR